MAEGFYFLYGTRDVADFIDRDGAWCCVSITSDGFSCYDKQGLYHRAGGPAIVKTNGDKEWHHHGPLHRFDGPALEFADGRRYWYIHGEHVPAIRFVDITEEMNRGR